MLSIRNSHRITILIVLGIVFLSSCNLTSSLQSNEKLLVKNKIIFENKVKNKLKLSEELQLLTFQKPNSKLFYTFPLKLGIYNMANDDGRENKFKWWIKNKLGEPPVVFKEPSVLASSEGMKNYLFNLGYLYNEINTELIVKNRKVSVKYFVNTHSKYELNTIKFPEATNDLTAIINKTAKESLLQKGDFLNINTLDQERIRISNELRNQGYYYFNKEYLSIEIDTTSTKNKVDLEVVLNPPKNPNGQKKYKLNEIYIYTDYFVDKVLNEAKRDTLLYEDFYFIYQKNQFKPKALLFGVFFKKGDYYSLENLKKTQKKIFSFGAFKFVNIEYKQSSKNDQTLDVFIYLTPSKKQVVFADVEVSHSFEGLSGTAVSLTYRNRNFSKASDLLQFKISAGVELNLFNRNTNIGLLNSADITADLSYYVNKFILPFPLKNVSKNSNVKTKFSIIYNYEERIKRFSKHTTSFTAGYEWNETQTKKHFYNPINISLLLIPSKDSIFQAQLDRLPSLSHSFEENIIFGSNYTFLMTNKKGEEDKSYFRFQGDIYLAGNFVHLAMLAVKKRSSDTIPYKILGKEYAQFARFEGNIVQHNKINNHSELVTRFNAGMIIPYGNSDVAPYFQQFFVGGSNSLRAFRLRALGPGVYSVADNTQTTSYFDQSGDIKLEANVEVRFDLYKWFKWAFFVDAGNVWTLKEDPDRLGGAFKGDFYKQIAVGFGSGLRLDFSYFVIRTDLAMPIFDPRLEESNRFRLTPKALGRNQWSKNNLIFNLAIGYPF